MKRIDLPRATIGRIPIYVRYLKDLQKNEPQTENISATALARASKAARGVAYSVRHSDAFPMQNEV